MRGKQMTGELPFGSIYTLEPDTDRLDADIARLVSRECTQLENELCELTASAFCVLSPGGHRALNLALRAAGVNPGERVLCSGLATDSQIQAILLTGGVPMLVDINPNTFNIDPYCLEYVINKCRRTSQPVPRVLVAGDLFGLPAPHEALEEICGRHGVALVQDLSESLGSAIGQRYAGAFGRFGVASLAMEPTASRAEEAGAVFCRTSGEAAVLRELLCEIEGGSAEPWRLAGEEWARASVALSKLEELSRQLKARTKAAERYRKCFRGSLRVQQVPDGYKSAWSRFGVLLPAGVDREALIAGLHQLGIPCEGMRRYTTGAQDDWERVMLRNSQSAASRLMTIPIHPYLTRNVAEYIAGQVLCEIERLAAPDPFYRNGSK